MIPQNFRQFRLTQEEVELIVRASRPRVLTLDDPRTPQELCNAIWIKLGHKYGFDGKSAGAVRPHPNGKPDWIIAIPTRSPANDHE